MHILQGQKHDILVFSFTEQKIMIDLVTNQKHYSTGSFSIVTVRNQV